MKLLNAALGALMAGLVSMPVYAQTESNIVCPVGQVSGMSLDDEFGPGTSDLTNCITKRAQVKMVVQINQFKNANGTAYGLGNITNIIDDYEITHGMVRGRDYEIVVVLHGPGGMMALTDKGINGAGVEVASRNPFQSQIEGLIAKGVKVYFCQNTTRAYLSNGTLPKYSVTADPNKTATSQLIPGVEYTTAGLTSIADFQARGYQYIQP